MSRLDNFQLIADELFNDHDLIHFRGEFYLFNEGIWRKEDTENTMAWIRKIGQTKRGMTLKLSEVKEIISMINAKTYETYRKKIKYMDQEKTKNEINLQSGILNLDTLETRAYTKEDFCFHKLPFDYVPNPKCPIMAKFLSTSMGFGYPPELTNPYEEEDYRKVMTFIQESMGYSMVHGNPHERAWILTGRGRNGKGTLLKIWQYILGEHNVSTLGMEGLNNPQQIHMTRNKLVNLSKDSQPGSQLDTETMKKAVAGEEVSANPKYIAPYDFRFNAKIIMACNDLPFTKSTDENVRERFFILPFDQQFSEENRDKQLKQKLETEADQIFSWAVNGIKTLRERGYFDPPDRCKVTLDKFMKSNNSVMMWMEELDLADDERRCKRADAWTGYKNYCEDAKLKPYSKGKFLEKMEKLGYKARLHTGEWWFNGIKPMPNSEYANDPISFVKAIYN